MQGVAHVQPGDSTAFFFSFGAYSSERLIECFCSGIQS